MTEYYWVIQMSFALNDLAIDFHSRIFGSSLSWAFFIFAYNFKPRFFLFCFVFSVLQFVLEKFVFDSLHYQFNAIFLLASAT